MPHLNMSTMSTVTTLVARDPTLGDRLEIVNCISILAATQGDGTPFHSDSLQDENMVKLCIGLDRHTQKVYYGSWVLKQSSHFDLVPK